MPAPKRTAARTRTTKRLRSENPTRRPSISILLDGRIPGFQSLGLEKLGTVNDDSLARREAGSHRDRVGRGVFRLDPLPAKGAVARHDVDVRAVALEEYGGL